MIYADNAATTKLDIEAFEAMKPYLLESYGNASQPYSFSRKNKRALKDARKMIADCINADPDEIYFTSGGTESDNWAIKCFGCEDSEKRIITSKIEHHAILNACLNGNAEIKYLDVNSEGFINIKQVEEYLNEGPKDIVCSSIKHTLVSVMLVNNEIGTIQDIKSISNVAHKYNAIVHTDAVQAIGHIKVDVKELGVDLLSASAHKFNGPKGIGFLYIKKGTPIYPLNNGGSQEGGLRSGTENVAAIVGMAIALKNNCLKIEENQKYVTECVNAFFEEFNRNNIDYILNGPKNRLPGNINISIKGKNGESLMHLLDIKGVMVSTGSACDSVNNQVSHVIKAIECPIEYAEGTIRISLSKDNTVDDGKVIAQKLVEVLHL